MTLELSIRQKAARAKFYSILWLTSAILILVSAYVLLPTVVSGTINSIKSIETHAPLVSPIAIKDGSSIENKNWINVPLLSLICLIFGFATILYACFLLGKVAFFELESADRLRGIADALCICGDDMDRFGKAADIFIQKPQLLASNSKLFSTDDLKNLAEATEKMRP